MTIFKNKRITEMGSSQKGPSLPSKEYFIFQDVLLDSNNASQWKITLEQPSEGTLDMDVVQTDVPLRTMSPQQVTLKRKNFEESDTSPLVSKRLFTAEDQGLPSGTSNLDQGISKNAKDIKSVHIMEASSQSQSPSVRTHCRPDNGNSNENLASCGMNEPNENIHEVEVGQPSDTDNGITEDHLSRPLSRIVKDIKEVKTSIQLHAEREIYKICSSVDNKIKLELQNVETQMEIEWQEISGIMHSTGQNLAFTFCEMETSKDCKQLWNTYCQGSNAIDECIKTVHMEAEAFINKQRLMHKERMQQLKKQVEIEIVVAEKKIEDIKKDGKM